MRKILLLMLFGVTMLIAACTIPQQEVTSFEECVEAGNPVMESYPEQCTHDGQTFERELSSGEQCEFNGGEWIESTQECENLSQDICEQLGGEFEECESPCRNDPDYPDVMCPTVCVRVCDFS